MAKHEKAQTTRVRHALDELDRVSKEEAPRIPENVFSQGFLPAILGREDAQLEIKDYINIVGSPQAEAYVVDAQTGEELYRVPPIYAPINLNDKRKGIHSIGEIMTRASERGEQIPQYRTAVMRNLYGKQVDNAPRDLEAFIDDWNSILVRYGYLSDDTSPAITNNNDSDDGTVDYTGDYDEA